MSYSKILVPIAPGHGDEAGRAMKVARSLMGPDASITVIAVIEELPLYLGADVYALEPSVDERQRAAAEEVVTEFGGADVDVIIKHGHPTRTILNVAEESAHDCVVIASSQPGWHHLLLGSTASGVVRHAHCSVHVLRSPAGADAP